MEKIKKALELARQARGSNYAGSVLNRQRPRTDTPLENKIHYSQTKTIELSKEKLREKRVILGDEHDAVSTSYKVLRTHVLQRMKVNHWKTLAITSPTEGNGKTLTAINLAISLARDINHSVLLMDLDLRHPSIHEYFFDKTHPGLSEYLIDDAELNDILFNPGIDRLVILPGNHTLTNSSEMLSSPKMVKLVEELKGRYPNRITIFDMPPLLSCDDVLAFLPYTDAIMLIVEEGGTRKDDLKRAYDLIAEKNLIGSVLNKSEDRVSDYS
jgi:capsular exopolysaccharide synthesis family protein